MLETHCEEWQRCPLVATAGVRFYCGCPLEVAPGVAVGTLCVLGFAPRLAWSPDAARSLAALARQVVAQMQLGLALTTFSRANERLQEAAQERNRYAADACSSCAELLCVRLV